MELNQDSIHKALLDDNSTPSNLTNFLNPSEEQEGVSAPSEPLWKWFLAVILLAAISLTTGSPNLYPSQFDNISQALGISSGVTTFMLTGGVMLMYITLPTGIFMDHFGTNITFIIAVVIVIVSYLVLPFTSSIPGLFIFFYLLMAFGSASLFIVNLEIALSRSPAKIKGFSASIVSASLSLSFGLFLEIYKLGKKALKCRGYECVFSSYQIVAIVIIVIVTVASPVSFYFFRQFPAPKSEGPNTPSRSFSIFLQLKFYLLLISMFLTVFDGLLVISGGSIIWQHYGTGYPNGASDWGIVFSATNCVCTILLSALLDFFIHKFNFNRPRIFGIFWIILGASPLIVGILFQSTNSQVLFGIFMSVMGVPFGFGLTQIPALVSDYFGNELFGFVFGLVQIGSIAAAAGTMPMVQAMSKTGIVACFIVCASLHVIIGVSLMFAHTLDRKKSFVDDNAVQ